MITKISRMGRLPHFLRYGATLARNPLVLEISLPVAVRNQLGDQRRLGTLRYDNYGLQTTAGRTLSFCSTGMSRAKIAR